LLAVVRTRTYLNYDLSVQLDDTGGLEVAVLNSPAGEAHERHEWPFSDQDLEIFLLRVGHTRRGVRRINSPEMKAARDFGEQLYDAVFSGRIGTTFERSVDEAERRGKGLRLRLHTADAPKLSDVPWEYLYSTSLHRFLTVSTATPLVRYMEQPRPTPPLAVHEAVRILTMVSSPTDVAELDVEREWARIQDAVGGLVSRGSINLCRLPQATMGALQRELRQRPYHVFHFIGHGAFDPDGDEGVLMFEDERRRGHKVSGEHLGTILHDHDSLRLVVLNSCEGARPSPQDPFGGTAQALVRQGIPAVIAMQFEITDDAAIIFSHDLYAAIADGYPVDAALAEARKAIFTSGNDVEWGTPVLHMRAPDGRIFEIGEREAEPPSAPADDMTLRLADAERALRRSDYEGAISRLESIVRDYPEATAVADELEGARRSLRAERLYASARVLFRAEQWEAVVDRFVEIAALDPEYPDPDGMLPAAEAALAEQRRAADLEARYADAEAAMSTRDWDQAIRILGSLREEEPDYRDVAALLEEAGVRRDAAALRAAAHDAFDAADWDGVISRFEELRLLGPQHAEDPEGLEAEARTRLDEEEQRRRLQAEFDAAVALVDHEQYQDAIRILDEIADEQPGYPGVAELRDAVRSQAAEREAEERGRRALALYAEAGEHATEGRWADVIAVLDVVDELDPHVAGSADLRALAQSSLEADKATQAPAPVRDAGPPPAPAREAAPSPQPEPGKPRAPAGAPPPRTGPRWRKPVLIGGAVVIVAVAVVVAILLIGGGPAGRATLGCLVTDTPGIGDAGFNQRAWDGALQAQEELDGVSVEVLEPQDDAPGFRPLIESFIAADCDVIITVGFRTEADTVAVAGQHPDRMFAVIDAEPEAPNVRPVTFATDQASFLAGYLAAGMSETGIVGTFGGMDIPSVTIFMEGFDRGVQLYNAEKGTAIRVLGWEPDSGWGLFAGNFEHPGDGRMLAQSLIDEGADVIFPAAGAVGLGAASVCQETGACLMIGVDTDQFLSAPEYASVWLTSVEKRVDVAVFDTIRNVATSGSLGGHFRGDLANGGVGLAPFHGFDGAVPQQLKDELAELNRLIIDGMFDTGGQ
jgi:basic membrane lipoprotein Med (substrate-binding protein (PBP1-ABC) superfamily)